MGQDTGCSASNGTDKPTNNHALRPRNRPDGRTCFCTGNGRSDIAQNAGGSRYEPVKDFLIQSALFRDGGTAGFLIFGLAKGIFCELNNRIACIIESKHLDAAPDTGQEPFGILLGTHGKVLADTAPALCAGGLLALRLCGLHAVWIKLVAYLTGALKEGIGFVTGHGPDNLANILPLTDRGAKFFSGGLGNRNQILRLFDLRPLPQGQKNIDRNTGLPRDVLYLLKRGTIGGCIVAVEKV
ncbi:hypothetical protein [Roseinatronobacter sp. NSM]|uniref:hypothetical protein n=1 Tax=Roseinatronobacter sp. NSM TaxID=3457785 RepID=UPI004036E277